MRKLFVSVISGSLLAVLCITALLQLPTFCSVKATPVVAVANTDFGNGTIAIENSPCLIRYNWINVSGTQVINYVLYTNSDYPYPTPVVSLQGQFFQLADGTKVSVMSALDKMEIYKDKNGDGIPQANFTSGDSEILYYMYVNMSDSYRIIPIQSVIEGNITHYEWGFTYVNVYAYAVNVTVEYGVAAKLMFDHITLAYDFSLENNVSYLKTSFDVGKVTSVEVLDSSQFSLTNMSLALVYPTSTHTSKPYSTIIDDQPYNSSISNETAVNLPFAQVIVGSTKAYDFLFGGNYTLTRDQNNETYELKSEAASLSSIPDAYEPVIWQTSFFMDNLNLGYLFGDSPPDITVDYNESPLIYRICFSIWDGLQVQNDPVCVGYLFSSTEIPEFPSAVTLPILITGITLLALMVARKRKSRMDQTRLQLA